MNRHHDGGVLVVGMNWLGDAVMSLPALQAWRRGHPDTHLTLLSKPPLVDFWHLAPAIDTVMTLAPGTVGTLRTAQAVARRRFSQAYVLPNAFRSALIPWLGRIPMRRGLPGHWRRGMLSDCVKTDKKTIRRHQVWENMAVLGIEASETNGNPESAYPEPPRLALPQTLCEQVERRFELAAAPNWVGLIPGAARGPSKRWPVEHFAASARTLLATQPGARFAVLGTKNEKRLGDALSLGIGSSAVNLCGKTTLPELAAVLAHCKAVLCNDSGGMHLAAAVDTRVVAVYGLTDPTVTGPLGEGHVVLKSDMSGTRGRHIARNSKTAAAALRNILPENAAAALMQYLQSSPTSHRPGAHDGT